MEPGLGGRIGVGEKKRGGPGSDRNITPFLSSKLLVSTSWAVLLDVPLSAAAEASESSRCRSRGTMIIFNGPVGDMSSLLDEVSHNLMNLHPVIELSGHLFFLRPLSHFFLLCIVMVTVLIAHYGTFVYIRTYQQ